MDILDRLLGDLAGEGTLTEESDGGGLVITHFHNRALEPPASLIVDPESLQARLDDIARGGPRNIWLDVDAQTEAYRLLLVHLDEEIDRYDAKISSVEITPQHVKGTPRADWSNTIPLPPDHDETFGWWAQRPPYADPAGH
jgi:hypothetical protein